MTIDNPNAYAVGITKFCRDANISRSMFYVLDRRGEAPPTVKIGRRRNVIVQTGRDWLKARESVSTAR